MPVLLSQYEGKIKQVSADGAYDSHACFDAIASYDAIATIPTQPNPKHKPKRDLSLTASEIEGNGFV